MAFDEKLAERMRKQLDKRKGLSGKKMFGGLITAERQYVLRLTCAPEALTDGVIYLESVHEKGTSNFG